MNDYELFLQKKRHTQNNFGIDPQWFPYEMFDFQKHVASYLIKKGRAAAFLDTGLGKTVIELTIAQNYSKEKPVLIITPLAVAFQFLKEAETFGINDISYSKNGKYDSRIVICNYERLDKFDSNDFDCVILDESSILKNFDGMMKGQITSFLKKVKYRFLFTATPSPNDFIELGTSSEALGYLGYTDMLTKFFTNKVNSINPANYGDEWILKGHAKESFFQWVSSWSISARSPYDLGFDGSKYILPELITNYHSIKNDVNMCIDGQFQLINVPAKGNTEIREESKHTIQKRCEKAVELSSNHENSVYWTNLNPEADLIQKLDKDSYQIKGSMSIDQKEEILLNFFQGNISKLVTKPKMTAFGLNWQHCSHTVFFPTYSYEQYYQSIRRFWRFGQKNKVTVDIVHSDGQSRIIEALNAKMQKANDLFTKLNSNINQKYEIKKTEFSKPITLPTFIQEKKND